MAISMNWVKDYVDLDGVDLKELANKITKAGVNVEKVITNNLNNLVVGNVLECSDIEGTHLHLCKVDDGKEVRQIVCGAPNVKEGIKAILALPGAVLPHDITIKVGKIRGFESEGMLCALSELGLEEENEENRKKGIYILPSDAKTGDDALNYLGTNDTIYELDLNPNRNIDCTNHLGFAYEVASVLGKKVNLPSISTNPIKDNISSYFSLDIETDNCTLYNAKMVMDVEIKESPSFIKERLINAGMRPINNVVDISNYVMLECGQPLHFFDKDKLGEKITVRMANDKEEIVTLDGKTRELICDDIVITDGKRAVCIAGVMGGENTEVDYNTKNILIESAIFNPYNTRYTSLRLNLRSEASLRYERGLNYENTSFAIERACHLLEKYANGKVLSGTITVDKIEKNIKKAKVTKDDVNKTLGLLMTNEDIERSLNNLGFEYEKDNDLYTVTIPNRRLDVEPHKQDLIEEIGRLYGYDKIVSTLPKVEEKKGVYSKSVLLRKMVSKRLRSLGLNECRTYSLVSEEDNNLFKFDRKEEVKPLKPMSLDKSIIRQSIVPSLLKVYEYNKSHGVKDVFVYEISNTYFEEDKEDMKCAGLITGKYLDNSWNNTKVFADFYLLKGMLEDLFNYLGFKNRYDFKEEKVDGLHPYVSAVITLDRENIGYIGKVHPKINKDDLFVFEISLSKILDKNIKPIKYKEISKYPSIVKDLAFIVDEDVTYKTLAETIRKKAGKLLTDIKVFDIFKGDALGPHKKSIAFSLVFQDKDRTLNDEEVMEIFNSIISEVEKKHNAQLRDK